MMNIHAFESNRTVLYDRKDYLHERLAFALARFEDRMELVEVRFEFCRASVHRSYRCRIKVELKGENASTLIVVRGGKSKYDAFNLATDAIESRLSAHVNWKLWFDKISPLFMPRSVRRRLSGVRRNSVAKQSFFNKRTSA